jgi:hypothetical protein
MNVIQPGQVAVLNRQSGVAKIEPHLPALDGIQLVQLARSDAMQIVKESAEIP